MRLLALLTVSLLVPRVAAAQSQPEMTRLACAEADAADAALNVAYRALRDASVSDGSRRALRDAQRAWIAFRDAELASVFYLPTGRETRYEYGSIYPMDRCYATKALTEARTAQLWERLHSEYH